MRGLLRRLYRGETNIDFIGRRKLWFAISAVVVAISIASLIFRGLNYGIEFEGGVAIRAPIAEDGPLADASDAEVTAEVRGALEEFGASEATIQVTGEGTDRSLLVQTEEIADPDRQAEFVQTISDAVGVPVAETDSQRIGSKWGEEITGKALRALVIFLIAVTLFISIRFEWKMGVSAILALVHDLTITAGIYSLIGFEVTPSTVIAILTILGYSLYDTVVVFDKVEEDTTMLAATGRMTYQDSANQALNEVFMRSLNTSLTTLLPVAALLFVGAGAFGAETLKDLALALFVGILTGAYSSIFTATPFLSMLKEREPKFRSVRDKVLRDARRGALPTPAAATAGPGVVQSEAPESSRPGAGQPATATRPAPKSRVGTKKAKRRKRR